MSVTVSVLIDSGFYQARCYFEMNVWSSRIFYPTDKLANINALNKLPTKVRTYFSCVGFSGLTHWLPTMKILLFDFAFGKHFTITFSEL